MSSHPEGTDLAPVCPCDLFYASTENAEVCSVWKQLYAHNIKTVVLKNICETVQPDL